MKEADYRKKIGDSARRELRGAVVINHEDKATANIPDVQILHLDRSSWIEVKLLRPGENYKKIVRLAQLIFGDTLARVCGGRSWTVVFNAQTNRTEVWIPRVLAAKVWPNVCGHLTDDALEPWLVGEGLEAGVVISAIKKMYARAA